VCPSARRERLLTMRERDRRAVEVEVAVEHGAAADASDTAPARERETGRRSGHPRWLT